jgi:hypothetical protein
MLPLNYLLFNLTTYNLFVFNTNLAWRFAFDYDKGFILRLAARLGLRSALRLVSGLGSDLRLR